MSGDKNKKLHDDLWKDVNAGYTKHADKDSSVKMGDFLQGVMACVEKEIIAPVPGATQKQNLN